MQHLHLDIETFSSVNLKTSGLYRYVASEDFEVLLIAYSLNDEKINVVDLKQGEKIPKKLSKALLDPNVVKHAHNATFERICLERIGFYIPSSEWECTMIKAGYCGLPLGLEQVSDALALGAKGKMLTGKTLIRLFCLPCKPTKANGFRTRNLPEHEPEKWIQFKEYCEMDVIAEMEISKVLAKYEVPKFEKELYCLDQKINHRGVLIDLEFATKAFAMNERHSVILEERLKDITKLENVNSPTQLTKWLSAATGSKIPSLAKDEIEALVKTADGTVLEVLKLRQMLSKTSIKKYLAMAEVASTEDQRARGLFQFYGAMRTGRWAGRLIQLQNLRRNNLQLLDIVRTLVNDNDYDLLSMLYANISDVLSQLIRTAFIAPKNSIFAVSDYSAIEAVYFL